MEHYSPTPPACNKLLTRLKLGMRNLVAEHKCTHTDRQQIFFFTSPAENMGVIKRVALLGVHYCSTGTCLWLSASMKFSLNGDISTHITPGALILSFNNLSGFKKC